MPAAYPTRDDLAAFFEGQGLAMPSDVGEMEIAGAVRLFEEKTGYVPFLAEETAQDYFYSPPEYGNTLELRAGFVEVEEVAVGLTDADQTGTVLTVLQDYSLAPYNASQASKPYTRIEFSTGFRGGARSIRVKGKKGYSSQVPSDVWNAILRAAAAESLPAMVAGEGMPTEIRQGEVTLKFDEWKSSKAGMWTTQFQRTANVYMRVAI